ncbi:MULTISPECIES: protealysin inhibitor emfourin [Mumia]|nr:protealysin inhibitor emfourin [Mumia sp. ZJ430]QMW68522.1 M4 family metallopeptidase [Mumia sp. ZJ1417]
MSCTFVPPYLLAHIAEATGRVDVSRCCAQTRALDADLRERRRTASVTDLDVPVDADGTKTIFTAAGTTRLPGDKARGDDEPPTGDLAVDEAYDNTGVIHTLFATQFGRDGIDGAGSPVTVTVHYGQRYDNAFWDGQQLVFGDGDGEVFERFTKPPDVLFHEFVHGVTQFTADLVYADQSGALNESMSDCFAALAKQQALGQSAEQADWLIGEGLFVAGIDAVALRSMREPGTAYDDPLLGKDPQVGSMRDYVETQADNGGVHINSGIPNRAFALAALALGGNSWEVPGQIWYAALSGGSVGSRTGFAGFGSATVEAAERLFGAREAQLVREAWAEVGVVPGVDAPSREPAGFPTGTVRVQRSGGFAGLVREGVLDLDDGEVGAEVAALLGRTDLASISDVRADPDRFIYTFAYGDEEVTVPEVALTPELSRVASLVLGEGLPYTP